MLTKKQIIFLGSMVLLFSLVGYINWRYREEIKNFVNNSQEEIYQKEEGDTSEVMEEEGQESVLKDAEIETEILANGRIKIINERDGYSFVLPENWKELDSGACVSNQAIEQHRISTCVLLSKNGKKLNISKFDNEVSEDLDLESWVQYLLNSVGIKDDIGSFDIQDVDAIIRSGDYEWVYFKGENVFYAILYTDKEEVREMISGGVWWGEPRFNEEGELLN